MTIVHDFHKSLQRSREHEESGFWLSAYKHAFPTLKSAVSVREDGWAQRGGIDRVLMLECGRVITVDEKVREKDYGDILLERWSNFERRVDGWIVRPLACEYIAYAVLPIETCYLFPTLDLQRAWRVRGHDWMQKGRKCADGFSRCIAQNTSYRTVSFAVPLIDLLDALKDALVVSWAPPRDG